MGAKQYKLAVGTFYASLAGDMLPTVKDLFDFVLTHKTNKSFIGYSNDKILQLLVQHIGDSSLYWEQSLDGKISGMIMADFHHDNKIAYVTENMAISLDRLGRFAAKLKQTYPDYRIEAMRHGGYRTFNTEKLYKKLI